MSEYFDNNLAYLLEDDYLNDLLCEKDKRGNITIKKSGLSRVSSGVLLGRIKMIEREIKRTKDVSRKIDLLGLSNFYVGALVSLSINTKLTATGIR